MNLLLSISKVDDHPDWLGAGVICCRSRQDGVEFLTEIDAFL